MTVTGTPANLPANRPVIVGVRPDDLTPTDGAGLVEGTVIVQEPLGAETLIYVDVQGTEVIAKASGRTPPAVGSVVKLGAAPENLHLFDATTQAALS